MDAVRYLESTTGGAFALDRVGQMGTLHSGLPEQDGAVDRSF